MRSVPILLFSSSLIACAFVTGCWDFSKYDNQASTVTTTNDAGGTSDSGGGGSSTDWQTLKLVLHQMAPHPGDFFEYRIVSPSNVIISRGDYDPLGDTEVTIVAVNAVPPASQGTYHVDFWADSNKNHVLDPPPADHQWRRMLSSPTATFSGNTVTLDFLHSFNFDDINTDANGNPTPPITGPADVIVTFTNAASLTGKLVNVRILDPQNHQVGQYRYQSFPDPASQGGTVTFKLPGITEEGLLETVEIYADLNGNRTYDPVSRGGPDKTWKLQAAAQGTNATFTFDPTQGSGADTINDPNL